MKSISKREVRAACDHILPSTANFSHTAPHLLKPEARPKRDPEAQLKKQADSNISGHALSIEGTTDPAINNVTEVDKSAESEVLPM